MKTVPHREPAQLVQGLSLGGQADRVVVSVPARLLEAVGQGPMDLDSAFVVKDL